MQSSPALLKPKVARVEIQMEVLREIRRQLAPYQVADRPLTGDTVICDGTTVDSLTVMDMIVELEDRFDVSIPMKRVTEIRTVDQLADTIIALYTFADGPALAPA
jgi:acyl carrier protein